MKLNIFYSWQSDLPNRDNRSFIEECIKKAIRKCTDDIVVPTVFDYDRDTKGVSGAPDIAEIIFDKIVKCDIFICDVSIVNSQYDGRKTPNPNVLVELGYAAKAIGWDRIVCFFNEKYGCIRDLPFDLNHRRIFQYNSDNKDEKANIVEGLSASIKLMHSKGLLYNPLKDYMKGKIDYCLLGILKQVSCMIYGTVSMSDALAKIPELLSLDEVQLHAYLGNRGPILGFFALNNLSDVKELLNQRLVHLTTSNLYPLEWSTMVLRLLDWMRQYQYLISGRGKENLYNGVLAPSPLLEAVAACDLNPANPSNAYLLVKKLGKDGGEVLYSATMPRMNKNYLVSPFRLNESSMVSLHRCLFEVISLGNRWLHETGSEFVLDPDYYVIRS